MRVAIMSLIFTGHEEMKLQIKDNFKNCVSSLKLKDMPLKGICITEEFIYKIFETSDKGAHCIVNTLG